jgi:hypothetical protein
MGMVGGSHIYDGPGLGHGPWKCPACAAANTGSIDDGCTSCGSGSAKPQHVGNPPPPVKPAVDLHLPLPVPPQEHTVYPRTGPLDVIAAAWYGEHPTTTIVEAFIAGYLVATAHARAHTIAAPPVTADLGTFHPDGKVRRTIIAALELFKDQVLRDAQDEIASGEWCSIEEIDQVIRQLKDAEETTHG